MIKETEFLNYITIPRKLYNKIEALAASLFTKHGIKSLPIDPFAIAKSEGMVVRPYSSLPKEATIMLTFMRNDFEVRGKYGFALIQKQDFNIESPTLIACSDTRANDNEINKRKGVHFFVDDYRFNGIYDNPERSLERYSQYAFLLSPDFSTYADMDLWRQIESIAKNRWVGAYWQSKGRLVIPTISWSTPRSYEFCFDAVEQNATIAIGMIGCKRNKSEFLRGYNVMLEKLNPEKILCFGTPFEEMEGNIIPIDYRASRKVVR